MDQNWYFSLDSKTQNGPFQVNEIRNAISEGRIKSDTYIWHPTECTAWTHFERISSSCKTLLNVSQNNEPPKPPEKLNGRIPLKSKPTSSSNSRPTANELIDAKANIKASSKSNRDRIDSNLNSLGQGKKLNGKSEEGSFHGSTEIGNGVSHSTSSAVPRRDFGAKPNIPPQRQVPSHSQRTIPAKPNGNPPLPARPREPAPSQSKYDAPRKKEVSKQPHRVRDILVPNGAGKSHPSGWMKRFTMDGVAYYHNVQTGALTWDCPDELKDPIESSNDSRGWVWFPDDRLGYVPAVLIQKRKDGKTEVELENGSRAVTRRGQECFPLRMASLLRTEADLTLLESLDEGLILYNLQKRFEEQQQIYSWIGNILISINPYQTFPIYGVDKVEEYKNRGNRVLDPHVYIVTDNALTPLLEYGESHSILISGESGAGKTWNTKQCLNYVTETIQRRTQTSVSTPLESKILCANPILESFGNAKTIRNDNSSRFGRFTMVQFKQNKSINGARIENFLLEKSRVVHQAAGERNYHAFYQLLASPYAAKFNLSNDVNDYRYLNSSGCASVDGVDDQHEFDILLQAFDDIGFTSAEVDRAMEFLAIILNIGNITFVSDGGEGSSLNAQGRSFLESAARALGVDQKALEFGLVHRTIEVRGNVTNILLRPDAAKNSRDALSKAIYGNVFDWLIKRINESLSGDSESWAFLGLLDIFGFEIFDENSFEQLCINFTNENLQQLFNRDTFKLEEALYRREGVQFDQIQYVDNQPILDLIQQRPAGLLLLLDDMNLMPRSTDVAFVSKSDSSHKANPFYVTSTLTARGAACFTVKHYAGDVVYHATGFLEKNKDLLLADLYDVISESTIPHVAQMFPPISKQNRAKFSLGAQFRKQLETLMQVLSSTQSHYIRCIKPNQFKKPRLFDPALCLEQFRYSGIFESVRIRKQGFPFRYTFDRFVDRYKCIMLRGVKWVNLKATTPRDRAKEILDGSGQDLSAIRFGKTMVLYRSEQHRTLELLRALALERVSAIIQAIARGFMARRFMVKVRMVTPDLERAIQSRDADQLDAALSKYSRACGQFANFVADIRVVRDAKRLRYALGEWEKLAREIQAVVNLDVSNDELAFEALKNAVWKGEDLLDMPGTNWHMETYEYGRLLFEEVRRDRLDPILQHAMDMLERDIMTEAYSQCKELRYQDERLRDIEVFVGMGEEQLLKMQYKKAKSLGLVDRAIEKEIMIREAFLDRNAAMFVFNQATLLRDPAEFSSHSLQFWKREELARNMLKFQKTAITTSITELDSQLSRVAIRLHKAILGWCGDKINPHPNSLAQEVISTGLGNAPLRDEIICLILKQTIENPNPRSVCQAWKLLGLCLSFFGPSSELGNYVHVFVRSSCTPMKSLLKQLLYDREYNGLNNSPPQPDDIPGLLHSMPS